MWIAAGRPMDENSENTARRENTLPTLAPMHAWAAATPLMDVAAHSDIGKVRKENEDQFLVAHLGRWMHVLHTSVGAPQQLTRPQGTLFVIADGMGGHGGGDVASAVTLDAFVAHSLLEMPWLGSGTAEGDALLAADMARFVAECQVRLHDIAARKKLPPRLGTTLTAGFLHGGRLVLAHVGDTRAYAFRQGQLVRLTRDHTLGAAIAEKTGVDPATIGHKNVLLNAIGGSDEIPKPEMSSMDLSAGDRLLFCSDGLHGSVDEGRIAEILGAASDASTAVSALIAEALAHGGPDNVTAIVAFG